MLVSTLHSVSAALLAAVLLLVAGCASNQQRPARTTPPPPPAAPSTTPVHDALAWPAIADATFAGLQGIDGPVTLTDGAWEGEPYTPGAAVRPVVELAPDFVLLGDLDGDGRDEAAVLLEASTGGTGHFLHLAVIAQTPGGPRNLATAMVGDRVDVRDGRIAGGRIVLDLVRHGPGDAACCPTELATTGWRLQGDVLASAGADTVTGILSLDTIGGTTWVLQRWDRGQPAPDEPRITLRYEDGQFRGTSGCNRYFAAVTAAEPPGSMTVGPPADTRRACPEPVARVEDRFLRQLEQAVSYGFVAGRLALMYIEDDRPGAMTFTREGP